MPLESLLSPSDACLTRHCVFLNLISNTTARCCYKQSNKLMKSNNTGI